MDDNPVRLLGIDYGKKRVGLALSDPLGIFATGFTTLENRSEKKLLKALQETIAARAVGGLVMGLPRRTTGEYGPEAEAIQAFGDRLAELTKLPIFYEDERYTSTIAQQSLRAQGVQPSRQKHLVDQTAAALILQQHLDRRANPLPEDVVEGESV